MANPESQKSPLDSIGVSLTEDQRQDVLDRVEERAVARSEDGYHDVEPSDEDAPAAIRIQRSIINAELYWHGKL